MGNTCSHQRLLAPQFVGAPPSCADCGESVDCPHPPNAHQTSQFIGGASNTMCRLCGKVIRETNPQRFDAMKVGDGTVNAVAPTPTQSVSQQAAEPEPKP